MEASCLLAGANEGSSKVLIQMKKLGERTMYSVPDIKAF